MSDDEDVPSSSVGEFPRLPVCVEFTEFATSMSMRELIKDNPTTKEPIGVGIAVRTPRTNPFVQAISGESPAFFWRDAAQIARMTPAVMEIGKETNAVGISAPKSSQSTIKTTVATKGLMPN